MPKRKGDFGLWIGDFGLRIENTKTPIEIYFKFRTPHSAFSNEKAPLSSNGGGAFSAVDLQNFVQTPICPCQKSEQA